MTNINVQVTHLVAGPNATSYCSPWLVVSSEAFGTPKMDEVINTQIAAKGLHRTELTQYITTALHQSDSTVVNGLAQSRIFDALGQNK